MLVNPLEYPLNSEFIVFQSQKACDRLANCGFFEKQVLFLEFPYCAVSGAGTGIIRDYKNKVFYKSFYSTQGVISGLTDQELCVLVDHENSELQLTLHEVANDEKLPLLTTLDEDRKRHIPEIAVLEEKYGKELVESTLIKVSNISYQYPIIPRHVLLYWACDFVDRRHSQLREFAIPMSKAMLQNQQIDKFTKILYMVQKEYGSRFPFDCFANILKGVIGAKHI
jgi:hypothetical protein